MYNQSGKVVLVLVLSLLALGITAYLYVPGLKKQEYIKQTPNPSVGFVQTDKESADLSECKVDLKNNENSEAQIWEHLSDDLKDKTYRRGAVSPGEATYEITLLKWTNDCEYVAFLVELVGREAGAYSQEDYKYRGVYIYEEESKEVRTLMLMPEELLFDEGEYGSNLWTHDDQYRFVLSESVKQGKFLKTRYLYDLKSNKLSKSVEEL